VVCLECGKEFPYDWKSMKVLSSASARKHDQVLVESPEPLAHKQAA
jgi:hypothetical protein